MRHVPNVRADRYRIRSGPLASNDSDGNNGAFLVPCRDGRTTLVCIVSDCSEPDLPEELRGWDHVSVRATYGDPITRSGRSRVPTWEEMCFAKELFFRDDECVVQYHPRSEVYVNVHPHVLHLWRRHDGFPEPPAIMVGPLAKERDEA